MRQDLVDIVKVLINNCRRLCRVDIPTNGINTGRVVDNIERILAVLLPTNVKLTVTVSLDGLGEAHERVRGVSGIFNGIEKTIKELKELMLLYPFFSLGLNMTISKLNYQAIEDVRKYAALKGVGINFTLAAISDIGVKSLGLRENFEMDQNEKIKLILSLEDLLQNKALDPHYAKFILTWLRTGRRVADCAFRKRKAFLVEPDGEVYACGNFKEFRIGSLFNGESFGAIWNKSGGALKRASDKCLNCASNCYMDELR